MVRLINFLFTFSKFRQIVFKKAMELKYGDKPETEKLEYLFTDSKGKKYYRYLKDDWMPVFRYNHMQARLLEIESRVSRETLTLFSQALNKSAEQKDFLLVARLAKELEDRIQNLYDPDLMVRFITGLLVREDQIDHKVWNKRIENEKYEQVIRDFDQLSFFFQKCSMRNYLQFSDTSSSDLDFLTEPLIENQRKSATLFDGMLTKILHTMPQK